MIYHYNYKFKFNGTRTKRAMMRACVWLVAASQSSLQGQGLYL